MLEISKFVDLITDYKETNDIFEKEKLDEYYFSCKCEKLKNYDNQILNFLELTDDLTLHIHEQNIPEAILTYKNNDDFETKYKNILKILSKYADDEPFSLTITINIIKRNDGIINLYSLKKFEEYLNNNSYEDIINSFNKVFEHNNTILFINESFETFQLTDSISFTNNKRFSSSCNRINYIDTRKKVCIDSKALNICPNDFHIINNDTTQFVKIQHHFRIIENILCIKFISNFSNLEKDFLTYRIHGNKILNQTISIEQLKEEYNKNLFDVYLWCYSDINTSEKINICRNIISMTYDSILNIDDNLLGILESNFRIYMIENVERYINVKTALTNQILDSINKLNEEYKSFYNTFKNNMLVFISAFISLFIIDLGSIETSSSESISSYLQKIYPIIIVFLIASIIWAIIGYFELKDKLCNKNKKLFDKLVNNYKDVLADDQIKSLTHSLLSDDITDLQSNSKKYFVLWILVIIITLVLLSIITFNLNFHTIIAGIKSSLYPK